MAQATPRDLVGEPVLIDEAIEKFDLGAVRSVDIVGIGISTGDCLTGYDILNKAKSKGATVIMGGIHLPSSPMNLWKWVPMPSSLAMETRFGPKWSKILWIIACREDIWVGACRVTLY